MSSFVINKEEYIKAAGIIAVIAEQYAHSTTTHRIWIYDYVTDRNMIAEDYYRCFVECYEMNALSVQEQYGDDTPETDDCNYMQTFNEYRTKVKQITSNRTEMQNIILKLQGFFTCAEYQTENKAYYWKMVSFFNRVINALLPFMVSAHSQNGWSKLEL